VRPSRHGGAWRVWRGALLVLLLASGARTQSLYSLSVIVFYDQNANGVQDPGEKTRIPGALVEIAGRTGRSSAGSGQVILAEIPGGTHILSIQPGSLPPFYRAEPSLVVSIPESRLVHVGVTLPIGANRPNTYMAFGDSITDGEGSSSRAGYRKELESRLRRYFGQGVVINESVAGATTDRGVRRVASALDQHRPAYTLILFGTNDWDDSRASDVLARASVESLRRIIRRVQGAQSLPFVATAPPTNVGFDERATPERNQWLRSLNELIRAMVVEEGAALVDLEKAFLDEGELRGLFTDHVHPNDRGYKIIAEAFFDAITAAPTNGPRPPSSEATRRWTRRP
jgi:lysophospholipase L1-like esterase